jgi:hypothetical protein
MSTLHHALLVFSGLSFVAYGISCLVSPHMRAEFTRFGLARFRPLVGGLELAGGCGQLMAWLAPSLGIGATGGLTALMLLGVLTRIKVGDGLLVTLPAIAYLMLNAYLLVALITR